MDVALDSLKCYCNDPVSNFTRCRKLPARTPFECIMSLSNYSSIGELSHFFEGHGPHFAFYETIISYLPVTAPFFMHEKKSLIEGLIYYICFFAKFQVSLHISSSVFSATHPNCSFARVGSA